MSTKTILGIISIAFAFSLFGAFIGVSIYKKGEKPRDIFQEYYDVENAVAVSPATLRKLIDEQDKNFLLIDLRSTEEYNIEHIVGAISIPAVTMNEVDLVAEFKKLPKDKQIIMHCYSAYCMLAREVGQVLAKEGIHAKELNIGWSEWKYYWGIWNPGEDPKNGLKYLEKGSGSTTTPPKCTSGQFGC